MTDHQLVDEVVDSMTRRHREQPVHDFQIGILQTWLQPDTQVAAWSAARGSAKSAFAARFAAELVSGPIAVENSEIVVVASSHEQAGIIMRDCSQRYLRRDIEAYGSGGQGRNAGRYRVVDHANSLLIHDRHTNVRLRVVGSDSRRAHGLRPDVVVADEPAQWGPRGPALWAALHTSLGKVPGSRILIVGTRAADPGHFFNIILANASADEGTVAMVHAASPNADPFDWESVRCANPGIDYGLPNASLIRQQLNMAKRDPAALQSWKSLRLNMGVADSILDGDLAVVAEEWARALVPPGDLPPARGGLVWGLDIGGSSSLSAVAGYWPSTGRIVVRAAVGRTPDIEIRGRADGARDIYVRAVNRGELVVCGERLADIDTLLVGMARDHGDPNVIVADGYRRAEVEEVLDRHPRTERVWRRQRTTHGAEDLSRFRLALDQGRLRVANDQELLAWSIAQARTRRSAGGTDYIHSGRGKRRDDCLVALIHAVGEGERLRAEATRTSRDDDLAFTVPSPPLPQ